MVSEATDGELAPEEADEHRAFVREVHQTLASAYAWGGVGALASVVAILVGGWYRGMITSPLLWIGAVVVGLAGLMVVRWLVYRKADHVWERVRGYCETNDVDPRALRRHFGDDPMYQFFGALFELRERRLERRADDAEEPLADDRDEGVEPDDVR